MQSNTQAISGHRPSSAGLTAHMNDLCILTKRPNHCRLAPPELTMTRIAEMASGPSECRTMLSANELKARARRIL